MTNRRLGRATWKSALLFAFAASTAWAQHHHEGSPIERASALFRDTCSGCHVVPDPDFATDRAWLDQVNRTA